MVAIQYNNPAKSNKSINFMKVIYFIFVETVFKDVMIQLRPQSGCYRIG